MRQLSAERRLVSANDSQDEEAAPVPALAWDRAAMP